VSRTLRVVVRASNTEGFGSATSNPSPMVAPPPGLPPVPLNVKPPSVLGPHVVGKRVRSSNGSWTDRPSRFTYQWRRCKPESTTCADIEGATGRVYTAGADDVGLWLAVRVTAWNQVGSGSAMSGEEQGARIRPGSATY
jgi:hypothetical protein